MRRHRVSKLRYFHGTDELADVRSMLATEVAYWASRARGEPAAEPRRDDDNAQARITVGRKPRQRAPGQALEWADLEWFPVQRTVKYLAAPSPHVCDWRCEGAYKHSECRCSCGGRNHGIRGQAELW